MNWQMSQKRARNIRGLIERLAEFSLFLCWIATIIAFSFSAQVLRAQGNPTAIDDITGKYHFIANDDTLAILDEEGKLKGYVEVTQPATESTDVLTFNLTEGTREKNEVRFRTERIHGKFYRFSGTVARGKGRDEKDPDCFELKGTLEIVTVNSDTSKESIQTTPVTLKSIGKNERPDDN